jgi:pimeloyl-ACP methyl ester carboxylesterase
MAEVADDLASLLDALGVKSCAVAGVSMGGYIALSFWSKHPERVNKLVLSNTRARADTDTEKTARNEMIAAIQQNGAAILPDRMLPRLLRPNAPPDVVRTVRNMIEGVNPESATYAVIAMRDRVDFSTALHRMTCPGMVITGTDDVIIRIADSRALGDSIPDCRFAEVNGSGHLSSLENPNEFNRLLMEFL